MSENSANQEDNVKSLDAIESENISKEEILGLAYATFEKTFKKTKNPFVWGAYDDYIEGIEKDPSIVKLDKAEVFLNDEKKLKLYIDSVQKRIVTEREAEISARVAALENSRIKNIEKGINGIDKKADNIHGKTKEIKEDTVVIKTDTSEIKWGTSAKMGFAIGVGAAIFVTAVVAPIIAVVEQPYTDALSNALFHKNANELTNAQVQFLLSNLTAHNFSMITNNNITTYNITIRDDRYCKNRMPVLPKKLFAANRTKKFHRQHLRYGA